MKKEIKYYLLTDADKDEPFAVVAEKLTPMRTANAIMYALEDEFGREFNRPKVALEDVKDGRVVEFIATSVASKYEESYDYTIHIQQTFLY